MTREWTFSEAYQIDTHELEDGFLVDVVWNYREKTVEAWLYHEKYGVKQMIFELPYTTLEEGSSTIYSALDASLPFYIVDYMDKFMDEA